MGFEDFFKGVGGFISDVAPDILGLLQTRAQTDLIKEVARTRVGLSPSIFAGGTPLFPGQQPRTTGPLSFVDFGGDMGHFNGDFQTAGLGGLLGGAQRLLGMGNGGAGQCGPLFREGRVRSVPLREISQRDPVTGTMHVWRHMGRPVLYSGDLATCKRVGRIARRARITSGRRSVRRKR